MVDQITSMMTGTHAITLWAVGLVAITESHTVTSPPLRAGVDAHRLVGG